MRRLRGFLPLLLLLAGSLCASAAGRVHIEVMGLFHPHRLYMDTMPGQPLILTAGARQLVIADGAQSRVSLIRSGGNILVEMAGTEIMADEVKFSGDRGDTEFVLSVPGKLRRLYRGQLSVKGEGGELLAVVEMDLEIAVASIVAAESPSDAPLEALKAQAIVSRSYLVAGGPRHPHADFCDTTHCQFLRNPPQPESPAGRATRATEGLVLAWQGKVFPAMYSASCGGRTHTLAEIGLEEQGYPYFAVRCPYCRRSPQRWSSELSERDAAALNSGSERERIKAGRKLGWGAVPSNTFSAARTGKGAVELSGSGHGHGVGLCQLGASSMAREGKDFRAILAYYLPNTTIESTEIPRCALSAQIAGGS